jgi:membrane-associated phospholipid phosphatase
VLAVICIVAIVAMGPARVMLGLHWTSDVLAGYAVGLVWLIVLMLVGLPWAATDNLPGDRSEPDSAPPPAPTEAEAQLDA